MQQVAPFPFHTLSQWQKQAAQFISEKNGRKTIVLDSSKSNLQLHEKINNHDKQKPNSKPISGGARARSVSGTVPGISIPQVLLTVRDAIEPTETPDDFLRDPLNIISREKIERVDYSELNSHNFLDISLPMISSDQGIWKCILDEIKILRGNASNPHRTTEKEHFELIKNGIKRLISPTEIELTTEEKKSKTMDRINLFNEKYDELFPVFQTDIKNKKLAKSQEKKDFEIIKKIREVIDERISLIMKDLGIDAKYHKPTPPIHKGKIKEIEKKPSARAIEPAKLSSTSKNPVPTTGQPEASKVKKPALAVLPTDDKKSHRKQDSETATRTYTPNNDDKPKRTDSSTVTNMEKVVTDLTELLNLLPLIYTNNSSNDTLRAETRCQIQELTKQINKLDQSIPELSIRDLSDLLHDFLTEKQQLIIPESELEALLISLAMHESKASSMAQ